MSIAEKKSRIMMQFIKRVVFKSFRAIFHLVAIDSSLITQKIIKNSSVPISAKIEWDVLYRTYYGYGTFQAALQAKALGLTSISVIEFGVAGGRGLIALEDIAQGVFDELGVKVEIFGFDTGCGIPEALDYRDMPYIWQKGFFDMDYEKLKTRLKNATVILGDVAETVPNFMSNDDISPIGFIAFDLDYYSSTIKSFEIFKKDSSFFLPRVFCYFDDIIGDDWEVHSIYTGELLAIDEFNQKSKFKKIAKIEGLTFKRKIQKKWNEKMYVFHDFKHPLYNKHIYPNKNWQFILKD
jgi:hypothetical protein